MRPPLGRIVFDLIAIDIAERPMIADLLDVFRDIARPAHGVREIEPPREEIPRHVNRVARLNDRQQIDLFLGVQTVEVLRS